MSLLEFFLTVAAAASAGRSADLADLGFLSGEWRGESGKAAIEEHWTEAAGGTMLGLSRTLVSGKTAAFEYLRIVERPDGVFYVAQPNGRPPTEFKMTRLAAGEAVFENPAHDHPKIIRYRLSEGMLVAEVEGDEGKEEFRFKKSSAP